MNIQGKKRVKVCEHARSMLNPLNCDAFPLKTSGILRYITQKSDNPSHSTSQQIVDQFYNVFTAMVQ